MSESNLNTNVHKLASLTAPLNFMKLDINTTIILRLTIFRDAAPESCQVREGSLEPL